MFIELIDDLRCLEDHPSICLVAAITERDERQVIEGILGCPTCRREYPIRQGIAWFRDEFDVAAAPPPPELSDENADAVMRIGAYLAAAEGATVALVGKWARYATELADLVGLSVVAVNPETRLTESDRVGILYSENRLPVKAESLRGVAVDDSAWSAVQIQLATVALAAGGRMVAPASARVPDEIEEIARDANVWVGEKRGPLVTLHRR